MSLFINPALDNYRRNPLILDALGNIQLLNLEEFREWYAPFNRKSTRILNAAASAGPSAYQGLMGMRQNSMQVKEKIADEILLELATSVCIDQRGNPAIGPSYGIQAVENLRNSNSYDILVAIDNRPIKLGMTQTTSDDKLQHIAGFIIAELGECKKKPDTWSVNLICTRKNKYGYSVKGSILLGAFLYCILGSTNPTYEKEGILELASGYFNISGFIAYTKMGFNKDLSLFQPDRWGLSCFIDIGNLPMSADVGTMTAAMIIGRATDERGMRRIVDESEDDSGLYNAGRMNDPNKQSLLIYIMICYIN